MFIFPSTLARQVIGLAILWFCATTTLWAQVPTQSTTYWEDQLARQIDSLRKAEVLLLAAKDSEASRTTAALAYAERSLAIGENRKNKKIIGLASLELSRLRTMLGNKGKARRYQKLAEKNMRDVDLLAELNRLETGKVQAEQSVLERQEAIVSSQQQLSALSSTPAELAGSLIRRRNNLASRTNCWQRKTRSLSAKRSSLVSAIRC